MGAVSHDDAGNGDDAPAALDVVVGVGVTDDQAGVHVVRLRELPPDEEHAEPRKQIELGEMRPVPADSALPAGAELVRLKPRAQGPAWDVEVLVPRTLSGPAQVATAQYRANWAATFDDDDAN